MTEYRCFRDCLAQNPPEAFQIRAVSERDDRGRPLYWSNEDGWVNQASADRYTLDQYHDYRLFLPLGGEWEEYVWNLADLCQCAQRYDDAYDAEMESRVDRLRDGEF